MDTEAFGSNCVPHLLDGFHCLCRVIKITPSVVESQTISLSGTPIASVFKRVSLI